MAAMRYLGVMAQPGGEEARLQLVREQSGRIEEIPLSDRDLLKLLEQVARLVSLRFQEVR